MSPSPPSDVDATVAFYCDAFGLQATDFSIGDDRSVLLFFPNGSFVQVLDAGPSPTVSAPLRAEPGNLIHEGAPLDHFSLFAVDTDALERHPRSSGGARRHRRGDHRHRRGRPDRALHRPRRPLLEVTAYPKR